VQPIGRIDYRIPGTPDARWPAACAAGQRGERYDRGQPVNCGCTCAAAQRTARAAVRVVMDISCCCDAAYAATVRAVEGRMEREAGKLSFEDEARVLLANARREHPMLSPDMRRWIEEACRRLGIRLEA